MHPLCSYASLSGPYVIVIQLFLAKERRRETLPFQRAIFKSNASAQSR